MEEKRIKLIVITGPTGSGKSALALELAELCGGEIVNADSLQLYRGMDIGTAKPGQESRRRVPHHLLDIRDPDEPFTAAEFRQEAQRAIRDIVSRGGHPVVVGGTGLYIRALLHGLVPSPPADEALRNRLLNDEQKGGEGTLHRRLMVADPVSAARLHPHDLLRIVRALEVVELTGEPLSSFHKHHGFAQEEYQTLKIAVNVDRKELYRRIDERVDKMMAGGLVEEVTQLQAAGYGSALKPLGSIGYKEISSYLAGELPLAEAIRLIKRDTRHYAKRQLTWCRGENDIHWVAYPSEFAMLSTTVMAFFAEEVR
ncbi:MAG TPA: tRNA (adenosine(37)-N6)-dimethylallyltransferase MiaA [Geobacterales bacterium]|nr:tRNA (adenosine(37)-N6)-dimethylallyltransferase MiaA [Geobacterales bacterium]